jgi:signal transduction histidine kinase
MAREDKKEHHGLLRRLPSPGLSVALKFMILVVLLQIVIGFPFFTTTVLILRNLLTIQIQRALQTRCSVIASEVRNDYLINNYSHSKETIARYATVENQKETVYIGLYDGAGSLIYSAPLSPSPKQTFAGISNDQSVILVSDPVEYKQQYLGRVDIYSTKNQVNDELLDTGKLMLVLSALSILITTPWTMFWAYYWMINPVSKLVDAAEKVSRGDLDIELDIRSSDEVGELAETFKEMAQSLDERGRALGKAHEQLKSNYQELERAHQKLQQLDEMKSEFMAIASHELLTPLSTIRAYAETLLTERFGPLGKEQIKTINIIERVVIRLSRIVDDFVDYTLLERGKLKFEQNNLSIAKVISETVEEFKEIAEERAIKLDVKIPRDLPKIKGDPYRLHQVFDNLLANAIKFTPDEGSISITSTVEPGTLKIHFSDSGIGISKKQISQIFLPFQQVERSTKRKFKGAGLGLAISKRIIEAHGGKIEVESKKGKGSTFTCLFPIE